MKQASFLTPNQLGALLVGTFLILLYLVEPALKNPSLSFKGASVTPTSYPQFPTDSSFSVIDTGKLPQLKALSKLSFKSLLQTLKSPNRLLLINFWATWCDPCIEELPSLNQLARQLLDTNDASLPLVVTVSVDENKIAVQKLKTSMGMSFNFTILHDPDGQYSRQLGILKFPETFLMRADGTILKKWIGPQDWLSGEIIDFLKKAQTASF